MEKEITSRDEMLSIIRAGQFLTLAMCQHNQPYLVTLNYAFDEAAECFHVHAALSGRKLDILRTNPAVWGQVLEDRGYIKGKCSHAYRCVMFQAVAELVENEADKRISMALLMDKFEPENTLLREKLLAASKVRNSAVLRLKIQAMSGKQSPAP